ncbi:hypothetical protein [Parapedobacter koreensis]|uniref:Uncharacterized protein n=1 Tax=Parapedobacter koreensis TaxID=332977 RepID=A0A1H7JC27_9SPHI|nr:hypothetical protein [Parapedobacter koreensis]SEK71924.1 hypothetical protein SAMN05421740_102509 [Parapedobacter koreensis]
MNTMYFSLTKILIPSFIFLSGGFTVLAQPTALPAEDIKRAIEAMLPEGEMTAAIADNMKYKLTLSIASDGTKIWFYTYDSSSPQPSMLDLTSINLEKNVVIIGGLELVYAGKVIVTDDKNNLQSKWQGHCWSFEEHDGRDSRRYRFTLGRLDRSGQTYLHIQIKEIENGERKRWLDYPLLF